MSVQNCMSAPYWNERTCTVLYLYSMYKGRKRVPECGNWTDVRKPAVKEARRGSRIWLGLGDGLHGHGWAYGLGGAEIGPLCCTGVVLCDLSNLVI